MKDLPQIFPTLHTQRLVLCRQDEKFISQMVELANREEIAKNLSSMSYPYGKEDAKEWIEQANRRYVEKKLISFAITEKENGDYMGNIDLDLSLRHNHATLGYWIGVPYWGRGYMSEAATEVMRYGFEELGLRRIAAHHFQTNPASGRVMEKVGMKLEGIRRKHFKKGETYLDIHDWGILREAF